MKKSITEFLKEDELPKLDPVTLILLQHNFNNLTSQMRAIAKTRPELLRNPEKLRQLALIDAMRGLGTTVNHQEIHAMLNRDGIPGTLNYLAQKVVDDLPEQERRRLSEEIRENVGVELRQQQITDMRMSMAPLTIYTKPQYIKRMIGGFLLIAAISAATIYLKFESNRGYIAMGKQAAISQKIAEAQTLEEPTSQEEELVTVPLPSLPNIDGAFQKHPLYQPLKEKQEGLAFYQNSFVTRNCFLFGRIHQIR